MFRLQSTGLPKDPWFPADFEGLGYFINDEDEIRSIENPRAYFKYFLTKNDRYNEVQKEAMNIAIRAEVSKRLQDVGMRTLRLPFGTQENEPHIPILASCGIAEKRRVVILFYEHSQDLGIFAQRIVGGHGGINAGSAVNLVKYVQSLTTSPDNNDSPGVILANMGQLRWWRRGKQAVTQSTWYALPQKNAVSGPYRFDPIKNTVPGNRSSTEHLTYVFDVVVKTLLDPGVKLDVIGVADGAVQVVEFLNKKENWDFWRLRINAMALLSPYHSLGDISNLEFAAWMKKRARAYVNTSRPVGTPIATPVGGGHFRTGFGCFCYSLGVPYYSEMLLPKGYKTVIDWFQEIAFTPGYENPEVTISEEEEEELKAGGMLGHMASDKKNDTASDVENGSEETVGGDETVTEEGILVDEAKMEKVRVEEAKVEDIESGDIESGDIEVEVAKPKDAKVINIKVEEPHEAETKNRELTDKEILDGEVVELEAVKGKVIEGEVTKDKTFAKNTIDKSALDQPLNSEHKAEYRQRLTADLLPKCLQPLEAKFIAPTTPRAPPSEWGGNWTLRELTPSNPTPGWPDGPRTMERKCVAAESAALLVVRKDMVVEWVAADGVEGGSGGTGCGDIGCDDAKCVEEGKRARIPAEELSIGLAMRERKIVDGTDAVELLVSSQGEIEHAEGKGKGIEVSGNDEDDKERGEEEGLEVLSEDGKILRSISFKKSTDGKDEEDGKRTWR